jgi:hypothetical protein
MNPDDPDERIAELERLAEAKAAAYEDHANPQTVGFGRGSRPGKSSAAG